MNNSRNWTTTSSQYGQGYHQKQYNRSDIKEFPSLSSSSNSTLTPSERHKDVQKRMVSSCITTYSPKIQAVCSKLIEKSNIFNNNPSTNNTIGYGLANIGQTCYMNSVLQVLFHLRNGELMKQVQSQLEVTEQFIPSQQLLFLLVLTRNLSSKQLVDYEQMCEVKDVVDIFATNFRGTAQQCSHEFFAKIRELMHDSLCRGDPKQLPLLLEQIPKNLSAADKCQRTWDCANVTDSSIISDYFRGQYLKVVKCNNNKCLHQSFQCDIFHDLQLHIPPTTSRVPIFSSYSLGSSLKSETFSDYLKFEFKDEYLRDATKQTEYKLRAVIDHFGQTLSQGHYTTTLRDSSTGDWFIFNDDQVFKQEKNEVERMFQDGSSTAYILFYELIK